jgi:hypothetical protein
MRRLLGLTLLLLACTVPLALAAGTPTDGTLSVKRGRGTLAIKVTGTVIGRVANGRIQVRDFRPFDGNDPKLSCKPKHRISLQVTWCKGRNIGFRVEDGRFTINVRGSGIWISAVAHGQIDVDGAGDTGVSDGVMSIDDGPYQSLPDVLTTYILGQPSPGS